MSIIITSSSDFTPQYHALAKLSESQPPSLDFCASHITFSSEVSTPREIKTVYANMLFRKCSELKSIARTLKPREVLKSLDIARHSPLSHRNCLILHDPCDPRFSNTPPSATLGVAPFFLCATARAQASLHGLCDEGLASARVSQS